MRILIVPRLDIAPERLALNDLTLPTPLVTQVSAYLNERRMLTTTIEIGTPSYLGITVATTLVGTPGSQPELIRDHALAALFGYINPLVGGPERRGWPFGRPLQLGEVYALLSSVEGVAAVAAVEEVRLFLGDLRLGERREGRQQIQLPADALFASFQHQVRVR